MRTLLLLALSLAAFGQSAPEPRIVSGVCQTVLNNTQIDTKPCELNLTNLAALPAGTTLRIGQVSAYCIGPIDRALRMVRLDTRLSDAPAGKHYTFVRMLRHEVRSPGLHAEYQGSQLAEAYAAPGLPITATVTAELGSLDPPIKCEVRFQGTVVP